MRWDLRWEGRVEEMLKFRKETEFKETEIGEIPKDWKIDILKNIVKRLESGNRPTGGKLKHDPNGILSIGGENIPWQIQLHLSFPHPLLLQTI